MCLRLLGSELAAPSPGGTLFAYAAELENAVSPPLSIGHYQPLNWRTDMLAYADVFYGNIPTMKTITFRATEDKVTALDSLAEMTQRDRSFILNEAVDQYLSLNDYHRELIEEGIRQVKAGQVIDHEQVKRKIASWASKGKK